MKGIKGLEMVCVDEHVDFPLQTTQKIESNISKVVTDPPTHLV